MAPAGVPAHAVRAAAGLRRPCRPATTGAARLYQLKRRTAGGARGRGALRQWRGRLERKYSPTKNRPRPNTRAASPAVPLHRGAACRRLVSFPRPRCDGARKNEKKDPAAAIEPTARHGRRVSTLARQSAREGSRRPARRSVSGAVRRAASGRSRRAAPGGPGEAQPPAVEAGRVGRVLGELRSRVGRGCLRQAVPPGRAAFRSGGGAGRSAFSARPVRNISASRAGLAGRLPGRSKRAAPVHDGRSPPLHPAINKIPSGGPRPGGPSAGRAQQIQSLRASASPGRADAPLPGGPRPGGHAPAAAPGGPRPGGPARAVRARADPMSGRPAPGRS